MSDERCSIDDLWTLLSWAETHAEMRPFDEIDEPRIARGREFIHSEIRRRERRRARRRRPAPSGEARESLARPDSTEEG